MKTFLTRFFAISASTILLNFIPCLAKASFSDDFSISFPDKELKSTGRNIQGIASLVGSYAVCLNSSFGYITDEDQTNYVWSVTGGTITGGGTSTSHSATIQWTITGLQSISVSYDGSGGPTTLYVFVSTYCPINAAIIPKFVDPLPHFAGIRVNAKAGGNVTVKAVPHQQVALSTGTILGDLAEIGVDAGAGMGNYWTYSISNDGGSSWTPPLWPGFTIEAERGNPLNVTYLNELTGQQYADVNLVVDQTLHWAMPTMTADPYSGPVPIVAHLHGGEVPSEADGGPYAWFTPGFAQTGPTWGIDGTDNVCHYPNTQEAATLWFHDHAMGATRLNVYAGLEAFYFLRGDDEENDHLPGWSGDDLVKEVAPVGTSGIFQTNPYLPEIELAIQDRKFNDRGELYWPVEPSNPDVHPYWTPEFFGDVMCVNGKSWPYLSVAPRKYRFRFLDGCNARFLNMWITNDLTGKTANGPDFQIIGADGGLLDHKVVKDISSGGRLFMAPGERFDVVIDFTGYSGTYYLVNDANIPYPDGDPVSEGLDDRIMAFVVNGDLRDAGNPGIAGSGSDKSNVPANLRATNLVNISGVTPTVTRLLTLNENASVDGPLEALVNNSKYDNNHMMGKGKDMTTFGDATEHPVEGTTEVWQIANLTMDTHPMHLHLVQFKLVNRRPFNDMAYMAAYDAAFTGGMYMPAEGPPNPYDIANSDGALGGNPSISSYYTGPAVGPLPEEEGWKDTYKCPLGEVTTFLVRYAPTDLPANATEDELVFPFDPSKGPGYVWHCHIVDHEDNEMMRPKWVEPSPARAQQVCQNSNDNVYSAPAGMTNYLWSLSAGGTITSGGSITDNTITVTWNSTGPQWVQVYYTSDGYNLNIPSYFRVKVNTTPVAGFTASATNVALNTPVTLTDESTGDISSYTWSISPSGYVFIGGTTASSASPQVEFNTANAYTVTLIASGPDCSDTLTKTGYIIAGSPILWSGTTSTDWNTGTNWSGNSVPLATDNVVIPDVSAGSNRYPVIGSGTGITCNDLTVLTGASLTVASDNSGNGSLISTGVLAGNITTERYITGSTNLSLNQYHLVSVPLNPSTNAQASLFSGAYLYSYNAASNEWLGLGTSTSTSLNERVGYMVYYPGASHTYQFTGNGNTGAFAATTTYRGDAGGYNFSLVPNPYPSNIDWNAASGWTKTNLGGTIWVYNPGAGNYATFNGTTGTLGGSQYIAMGQSYFVQTTAASPVLTMNNGVRTHNTASFLKETIANQLRIRAESADLADEIVIEFSEGASDEYLLSEDAIKFTGAANAPQLYTITGNSKLSINRLKQATGNTVVPMNFECESYGAVNLNFSQSESFPSDMTIVLNDNFTAERVDLRKQSTYTFMHLPGNPSMRFSLEFGAATGFVEVDATASRVWYTSQTLFISTPEQAGQMASVEVFNTAGQIVYSKEISLNSLNSLPLNITGPVVARVVTSGGVIITKAVLMK